MTYFKISRDLSGRAFDIRTHPVEDRRQVVAKKVLGTVQSLAKTDHLCTYTDTSTVIRSLSIESPTRHGRVELSILSKRRRIYLLDSFYGFGFDQKGKLYGTSCRRDLGFNYDIELWTPLGDIISCRYDTGVLENHLLPALQKLATTS